MPTDAVPDPNWAASDLLEHARRLAALASAERSADELRRGVHDLHARCVELEVDPAVSAVPARQRARLSEAFDRLACASDDLAAIVELRCADAAPREDERFVSPDVVALLARVTERHDHVVALLGRGGVRRSHLSA
jgi:hypothetical protein